MLYKFKKSSFEEFTAIINEYSFNLGGWKLIMKEYSNYIEKIENENGDLIALIHFWFDTNEDSKLCIAYFEVLKDYRRKGHGKRIITKFLERYPNEIILTSTDDVADKFWSNFSL